MTHAVHATAEFADQPSMLAANVRLSMRIDDQDERRTDTARHSLNGTRCTTWMMLVIGSILALLASSEPAAAQRVGTIAEWKKRIFDPATINLQIFPGSQRNLKFTIDQIRLDETTAKVAIHIIAGDQMSAAAAFYGTQLDRPVEESGIGTLGELRIIRADNKDPDRTGLTIRVEHAQWATGKGQVWFRYDPPH